MVSTSTVGYLDRAGASVHSTAIIEEGAQLGIGSTVGPYSIIGGNVILGANCRIGPHVVLEGHTRLGDNNTIFQFASVGSAPQDLKYAGEPSVLELGNSNIIREYVTLQPGTAGGGMKTTIGSKNLFMANSHVGHDSVIGDRNIFANSTALAGHVTVGNGVILGGLTAVHQFTHLGDLSFTAGGAMIVKDLPPYCMAQGDRAGLVGLNLVGLERAKFSTNVIAALKKVYKQLFIGQQPVGSAKLPFTARIEKLLLEYAGVREIEILLQFCKVSERGMTMPRRRSDS